MTLVETIINNLKVTFKLRFYGIGFKKKDNARIVVTQNE